MLVRESQLTFQDMPNKQVIQVVIPESLVDNVMKILHDNRAHPSRDETIRQARMKYYLKSMVKDITEYIAQCNTCAEHKGN